MQVTLPKSTFEPLIRSSERLPRTTSYDSAPKTTGHVTIVAVLPFMREADRLDHVSEVVRRLDRRRGVLVVLPELSVALYVAM